MNPRRGKLGSLPVSRSGSPKQIERPLCQQSRRKVTPQPDNTASKACRARQRARLLWFLHSWRKNRIGTTRQSDIKKTSTVFLMQLFRQTKPNASIGR